MNKIAIEGARFLAIFFLWLWTADVTSAQKPQSVCAPDCGAFGTCLPCDDSCVGERCQCDIGYTGEDCSTPIDDCPSSVDLDGSVPWCLNGGKCVAREVFEGDGFGPATQVWRCDCTTATGTAAAYAGTQCEFPATQSCVAGTQKSDYAFCVNGGDCKFLIIEGEEHPGCKNCGDYEGRHCQYPKGKAPPEELVDAAKSGTTIEESDGMRPGFVVFIVVLAGTTLGCLFLLVKNRQQGSVDKSMPPTDLQLEEKGQGDDLPEATAVDDGDDTKPEVV